MFVINNVVKVQSLANRLLPPHCVLCAAMTDRHLALCHPCHAELPALGHACQRCALPLADNHSTLCADCVQTPPVFERTIALWPYQGIIKRLISDFKYRRRFYIGRLLGQLLSQQVMQAYPAEQRPDVIIATPMHWLRRVRRGFNQSELLAQQLTRATNLPLSKGVNRRRGQRQQALTAAARKKNMQAIFYSRSCFDGLSVAIVDDVVTTGATANALSRVLREAGASTVHVWCLARTPKEA